MLNNLKWLIYLKLYMYIDIINIFHYLKILKALYAHRKPHLNCTVDISEISNIILHGITWEEIVLVF